MATIVLIDRRENPLCLQPNLVRDHHYVLRCAETETRQQDKFSSAIGVRVLVNTSIPGAEMVSTTKTQMLSRSLEA